MRPVDRPTAPCCSARRRSSRISEISSALGSRSSIPMTRERIALCPTSETAFTAGRAAANAEAYVSRSAKRALQPGNRLALPGGSAPPSSNGAKLKPQLPMTTLVTPCSNLKGKLGVVSNAASSCACTSTKPGASARPLAAISRLPAFPGPTRAMRSPSMCTSAIRGGCPEPSTTRASRMLRS